MSYDLPQLSALMAADDDAIRQTFADAGFTIYDKTNPEENPNGGLDLVKLPSDVSEVDAALLYAQGVSNLSAADAAKLLKGSWTFTVSRNDYVDMRVKYADFSSGSVEAAIQAAMASEGLDRVHARRDPAWTTPATPSRPAPSTWTAPRTRGACRPSRSRRSTT